MPQTHLIVAKNGFFLRYGFRECIGRVFCSLAILNCNRLHFNLVTRVVISHIDVFGSCAVCVSFAELYAALIVHVNGDLGLLIFQFIDEFTMP